MAQALAHADKGVSPTEWQASTHPPLLRQQIEVIFDGVDCDRLAPNPEASFTLPNGRVLKRGDEVLTFVNRNLEPYRGYHIFMRALPDDPALPARGAGRDRRRRRGQLRRAPPGGRDLEGHLSWTR